MCVLFYDNLMLSQRITIQQTDQPEILHHALWHEPGRYLPLYQAVYYKRVILLKSLFRAPVINYYEKLQHQECLLHKHRHMDRNAA